ncbi:DUF4177 domain-containing protein [Rubrivirga sp. IMCC43871]|uniref:DUF4177 domain-containing protein n=1 Tax=Rubrivirga sp. IMCC43871 TaxID=3391575 RepID=UPI0039901195
MTEYRVEARAFYSKPSLDKNHGAEASQEEVQALRDTYTAAGWRLASTDAASFGAAVYVYLHVEREV